MTKYFFITGTDTGIGKTLAACSLLQAAALLGYRVVGYKPVASGSQITPEGIRNRDALALMDNSNVDLKYNQVSPFSFIKETSPNIASYNEGNLIDLNILSKGLRALGALANYVVIEGAGGWFTPLGKNILYSDWVAVEKLPVILVVGIKLGCINHALLTEAAVRQSGLCLVGWVANHLTESNALAQDYIQEIRFRLHPPLLGIIPWMNILKQNSLSKYINLSIL
ncbi:dethiobiotin synthase [Candidatus Erwinia haradaeae]|nr:dethiobiotin synthase [Candidatus Erwinia haradaeae]